LLETEVVERASKPINSTHINQLVSILQQQGLAVSRNDHDEFMELDEKFHHALCQSVTLPRAWKVIQTVKDHLDRVRFSDFGMPDQTAEMIVQHTVIFNAIRSGDTKIAVEEMDMHLQDVCEKPLSTKEC